MLNTAQRYLTLKALGAPAVLLSLAMQGVFEGIKDTRTPLYAIGKHKFLDLYILFSRFTLFLCNNNLSPK
ncbi:hypothetical protein ACSBR2_034402 [Camellia fascicularis]